MNSKITVILLITGAALILLFVVWQYLFSIYEVNFRVFPSELYADSKSTVKVEAVPLNAFGIRAPFRVSSSEFEIIEGSDLVEVVSNIPEKGLFVIRAKDRPGKVVLRIKTKFSLWPGLVEITIRPNLA